MTFPDKKQIEYISLLILLLLSFIVILYPLRLHHFWDETVYLQHAEIIAGLKENTFNEFNYRPPVIPIILAFGFLLYHHVFTASVILAILGMLGVLFIYILGKEMHGKTIGFLAAIMLACMPFIVKNASIIMTDVPALTLSTFAMYLFIRYERTANRKYSILSGFFLAIVVLTKFTSFIMIPVFIVYALLNQKNKFSVASIINTMKIYSSTVISFILTFLPYLIWAQIAYGSFFFPFIRAMSAVSDLNEHETFYIMNFTNMFPLIIVMGFIISIIFFFYNLKREKIIDKDYLFMFAWFALFLIFLSLGHHKELRYLIPITTPIIILSSWGIASLLKYLKSRTKIFLAFMILLLITLIFSFYPTFLDFSSPMIDMYQTEEMIASNYIMNKSSMIDDEIIYTNFNYPVFAYYTDKIVKPLWIYDDSFYKNYDKIMDKDGIIIIYKQLKYPGIEWANGIKEIQLIKQFTNFSIYKYKKQDNLSICYNCNPADYHKNP